MKVLVVDGQGGGIGKQLVAKIKEKYDVEVTAVGTNSLATTAMHKAGADYVATGENAVIVNARKADVIVGAIGIAIADAMLGEITPNMAKAIAQSNATRILIPFNQCSTIIAGVPSQSMSKLIECAIEELAKCTEQKIDKTIKC